MFVTLKQMILRGIKVELMIFRPSHGGICDRFLEGFFIFATDGDLGMWFFWGGEFFREN